MTQEIDQNSSTKVGVRLTPGHLLAPFNWAVDRVAAMMEAEPTLLKHLFELDRARMHLIALSLAHLSEVSPDLGVFLFSASMRAITEQILGRPPTGIKRALGHLPVSALTAENYRHLVDLLSDPAAAKVLHHALSIDNSMINTLHRLPIPLRRLYLLHALNCFDPDNGFSDGLRLLVSRGAAPNFEVLVSELASASQPEQFFAKLRGLVESLPLSNPQPPAQVGIAHRIDQADTIRSLAKSWRNCLARYVSKIDTGTCALYLWKDDNVSAVCSIQRHGRLGWFIDEVKGPENTKIEPKQLTKIHSAFKQVSIPPISVIIAILNMIDEDGIALMHHRNFGRQRAVLNHV